MARSDEFYAVPNQRLEPRRRFNLTWTSVVETASAENNIVHARLFIPRRRTAETPRAAVVVLPQWNGATDKSRRSLP